MLAAMALAGALVLCAAHDRPTVGILTQRYDATQSYIAASYVKFVEGAGARAVPLHYDRWDAATLQKVLASVNGVLLPGGGAEFAGAYWDALQTIFTYATRANANGIHYPIWGTCLGFEELLALGANDTTVLDKGFDGRNFSLPLVLQAAALSSRLFAAMPEHIRAIVTKQNVTYNNHAAGITPEHMANNARLSAMFDVLSVNDDKQGRTFVSTIEGKKLPFYGVQWHPEKAMYEWSPTLAVNHNHDSVELNSWTARFFVNECRKNNNRFADAAAESQALIYQHTPKYTGETGTFTQMYLFPL